MSLWQCVLRSILRVFWQYLPVAFNENIFILILSYIMYTQINNLISTRLNDCQPPASTSHRLIQVSKRMHVWNKWMSSTCYRECLMQVKCASMQQECKTCFCARKPNSMFGLFIVVPLKI